MRLEPETQELIRHLREDWGFTYGEIAGYLNEKQIHTTSGKQWSRENVFRVYDYWYLSNDRRHYHPSENLLKPIGKVFSWAMYPVQSTPDANRRRD